MIKERIIVRIFNRSIHCAQLFTGLHLLSRKGLISTVLEDHTHDEKYPYKTAIAEIVYRGKVVAFDMLDGYNNIEAIKWFYNNSVFYFKRSFSKKLNDLYGLDENRVFPWGFNYHVSYVGNPCEGPLVSVIKELSKICLAKETNSYFCKRVFEEIPLYKTNDIKILFYSRLWLPSDSLSDDLNCERERINSQRIELVRKLKEAFSDCFHGGVEASNLAKTIAPDICLPSIETSRREYLIKMHKSDICIATTGLHNSIGWKMGEYVAAAKGIVSEPLFYEVPGQFNKGINYLEFSSVEECIESVRFLHDNPDRLYAMKCHNYDYYRSYLEPAVMMLNSIKIVNEQSS